MRKLKSFLLVLIILSAVSPLFGQFSTGIIGGINMANINADRETTRLWTWGAALSFEYYLSDNIALRVDPAYMKKGGAIEGTTENPRIELDLSYIDVPLLFKYDLNKPEDAYIIAGPSIGFLNSSELGIEINNNIFEADIKHVSENLNIGAIIGVGVNIPIPTGKLLLEIKYQHGFTNIPKNGTFKAEWNGIEIDGEMDEKETEFRTYGIQFMLGYLLEF